jgi:Domain of unknown function (DUF5671)
MTIFFIALGFTVPLAILVAIIYFIVRSIKNSGDEYSLTFKEISIDLGLFLFLVTSIASLISIIFSAVDKKFVDILRANDFYSDSISMLNNDVRMATSIILVAFPIYLALAFYKSKNLMSNPQRLNLPATRYVNYFIVGVSALFIIGSLISIIYQYLGGELGAAFGYKVLTVSIIAIALFVYNYYSLKRDYSQKSSIPYLFAALSLIAVIGSVVYSISILGSPAKIRMIRFDEKRLTDLSIIQQQILTNWQQNKVLPANMTELSGDGFNYGFVLPKDPRDASSYEYKILENSVMEKATAQKCATFYPNKFNSYTNYGVNGSTYDVSTLKCEIPSKAVFEVCGSFETIRAYDENGVDQSRSGWDASNEFGISTLGAPAAISSKYYEPIYFDVYNKNPNWNHDAKHTCFKRTIDPLKYPSYN